MAMTLASKQCKESTRKRNGVKFSSTVPQYIYDMQKTAKEVAAAVERTTPNKK
ncbi:MAG: hypothetical protein PVH64_12490 [Bacillota bacterium]|jgi:hypothetical protein